LNNLEKETRKTRQVYRELFLKAHNDLKKQINSVKNPGFCKKCRTCCSIRYSDLSPDEIFNLSEQGDSISVEYMKLFIPYGACKDFEYGKNNSIDITNNNEKAKEVNPEYVNLILSKNESPVYFYFCRYLEEGTDCIKYKNKNFICTNYPDSVSTILSPECGYRKWQYDVFEKLNGEFSRDILLKLREINAYRQNYTCKKTGTCCKLACSEFSYEELKQKAQNGDNFAAQFVSIFVPYNSYEEARAIFPEYVDMVIEKLDDSDQVYFYHCPHITEDNLCSIYESRPQICKDFPNNPLSILPSNCGFCEWKEDVHVAAMLMHALIEISGFYMDKINKATEH